MPEAAGEAPVIRRARSDEAGSLSDLALRSKGHWGYDDDFLAACRAELTVSPADLEGDDCFVLEEGGRTRGFYLLRAAAARGPGAGEPGARPVCAELELFYVDPAGIGRGYGTLLWRHLVERARRRRLSRFMIDSDPHAEGFYRAMGARRIGEAPSGSIPGRSLPRLQYDLETARKAR